MSDSGDFIEDPDAMVPDTPEMRHALKQIASGRCARFSRSFDGVETARELLREGRPHWFLDLLTLWRPAGQPSEADGLRLAVRDGYLNFYRRGQSVAKVSVVRGQLRGEVHVKYFSSEARLGRGQAYGRFEDRHVRGAGFSAPYEGLGTLRAWMPEIDRRYVGVEKRLVDALVAENDNVIDLEMGLPAWGSVTTAPRMDLVTIENQQVVFWEAKTAGDSRIRCSVPVVPRQMPHVLDQLEKYRLFLEQDTHCWRISEAYRSAARILVALRRIADDLGPCRPLGQEIVAASTADELRVAREAALVVLDEAPPEGARWRSWHDNGHATKLAGHARVLAQSVPGRLIFEDAV